MRYSNLNLAENNPEHDHREFTLASIVRLALKCHIFSVTHLLIGVIFVSFFAFGAKDAIAANWYVDNAASGSNNGTSWTNAWQTFGAVVWGSGGVVAGDSLYISGGATSKTYTAASDGMLSVRASGSSTSSRITIATGAKSPSPTGHDGRVIFDGVNTYKYLISAVQSYIKIDGEKSGAINWELKNMVPTLDNDGVNAISLDNGNGGRVGNTVTYVSIHDVSNGINASGQSTCEISYSEIYNVTNDHCIRAIGGEGSLGSIKIHHNKITNRGDPTRSYLGPDGIQGTWYLDIYNNNFISEVVTPTVGSQHPDQIQADFNMNRIYNNYFYGGINSQMFPNIVPPGPTVFSDFLVYNNVFAHSGWSGTIVGAATGTTTIQRVCICNNTFIDSTANVALEWIMDSANVTTLTDVYIANNIFYNCGGGGGIQAVKVTATSGQQASMHFDYNLINAGASGSSAMVWEPSYANITQAHGQTGVPTFTSYTAGTYANDYHLTSPNAYTIGTGLNLTTMIGSTDKDGVSRPGGSSAWDIGAYERSGSLRPPILKILQ
jgi:hypothetical protein